MLGQHCGNPIALIHIHTSNSNARTRVVWLKSNDKTGLSPQASEEQRSVHSNIHDILNSSAEFRAISPRFPAREMTSVRRGAVAAFSLLLSNPNAPTRQYLPSTPERHRTHACYMLSSFRPHEGQGSPHHHVSSKAHPASTGRPASQVAMKARDQPNSGRGGASALLNEPDQQDGQKGAMSSAEGGREQSSYARKSRGIARLHGSRAFVTLHYGKDGMAFTRTRWISQRSRGAPDVWTRDAIAGYQSITLYRNGVCAGGRSGAIPNDLDSSQRPKLLGIVPYHEPPNAGKRSRTL